LACSKPPEGCCKWTLELLTDEFIFLTEGEVVSIETVRRRLKDNDLKPWLNAPTAGSVTVDGKKVTEDNIKCLRRKIGYIPQNIYLFDGTVAENVSFGGKYNEKKIKEVLSQAKALNFLENNLNGIETKVGEGGVKLSGGQKQRIAIARAIPVMWNRCFYKFSLINSSSLIFFVNSYSSRFPLVNRASFISDICIPVISASTLQACGLSS